MPTLPHYLQRIGGQSASPIEFSGDNTGVTAGITLFANTTYATAPVLFLSAGAMGGGTLSVGNGAYAGLQFAIPASFADSMAFEHGAALGIESNCAVAINLSAGGIDRNIWLGSMKGAVYTGTLTPYDSTYRFGGGGCIDQTVLPNTILTLANTNALTGARDVVVGNPAAFLQPGVLALAASNSFTGGITLNAGRCTSISGSSPTAAPTLISRAPGALGTGPITINRNNAVGSIAPTLQFEGAPQTVANDILITNIFGAAAINAATPTILRGNLTATGGSNLNLHAVAASSSLLVFDQTAAGNSVLLDNNSRINQFYGVFDPQIAAHLPLNAGYRMDAGAALVLSPGFTWSDLTAGRTWVNSSTPVGGQWTGGGFAGRGTRQLIDNTGTFQTGTETNWLDRSFILGASITNSDGTFYANAGVKIARDFTITGDRAITVASTGPGLTNASTVGFVNEIAGTINGPGMLRMGATGPGGAGQLAELVLSGTSIWTGSTYLDYGQTTRIATGPGGLGICQVSPGAFIRFKGNASIPSNNNGSNTYIAAIGRSWGDNHFGYLLTGTPGNETYSLRPGYRFLLGGANRATLGSTSGGATLGDVRVTIWQSTSASTPYSLNLLTRDTDALLTLGSSTSAVCFSSGYCLGVNVGAGLLPPGTPGTPLTERTAINTLIKRGPGTLVLQNVKYTLLNGTGDNTANFWWQLGSGTVGLFDGVVRETGTDASNSVRSVRYLMDGGMLGLAADYAVTMGTNATRANMSGARGAGFAAYGGKRTATLAPQGGDNLRWGETGGANNDFFMNAAAPLFLNAPDADGEIELAASAPANYLRLDTGIRDIRVHDNPASDADRALISMRISNTSGACALSKSGAGLLILTATNNNWGGSTYVSNGTLMVNGTLLGNSPSNVIVCAGATLCGTGTVYRPVTVLSGGTISAGGVDGTGVLTVSNLTLQAGAGAAFTLGAGGGYPRVNVLSNLTLAGTLSLNFTNRPPAGSVFNLFDWGSLSNTFGAIAVSGALPANVLDTSLLYSTGVVRVRNEAGTFIFLR